MSESSKEQMALKDEQAFKQFSQLGDKFQEVSFPEPELIEHLDAQERALVTKAYNFASYYHAGQKRISGKDYIVHLMDTARILAQYKLDAPTLATALLHDLFEENTKCVPSEVKLAFGPEIASLVEDVTKLTSLFARQEKAKRQKLADNYEINDPKAEKADMQVATLENLRRIFLAIAKDLRVILVKLADRLDNLRDLYVCKPEVQVSIARETLDIFTPIASRLGIWEFKAEMEDLAFRYAHPVEYRNLVRQMEAGREVRERTIQECVNKLKSQLGEMHIKSEVEYRTKHLYSVYKKMLRTGKTLEEVYDLSALRVIVETVEQCYMLFGMVHATWAPVPGRIKDYIARPKANNYRSLHTTVMAAPGQPVEVQIRTFAMHHVNEVGVAAHWAYKEGKKSGKGEQAQLFSELYPWIRALFETHEASADSGEYTEHLKVNMLERNVFVFTPKGDVLDLPVGSTPIDAAYRIHTEVGHRCVGAVVNGRMVPLSYKLKNADIVQIQTSKNGVPSRDWMRICGSHSAVSKIRAWFKRERREENIANGRDSLRRELAKSRQEELLSREDWMLKVAEGLNYTAIDDLLAAVGYGEVSVASVISRLNTLKNASQPVPTLEDVAKTEMQTSLKPVRKRGSGREVLVEGMDNVLIKFAHCCAPVPGDRLGGYISLGKGVSVHRSNCPSFVRLAAAHPERIIGVSWNEAKFTDKGQYVIVVEVQAYDRSGLMSDIMSLLNDMRLPVKGCAARTDKNGLAFITLTCEVSGQTQIEECLRKLKRVRNVVEVSRR